jgi:hypothetical protein
MMSETKITPPSTGCYVDGHWGQYGIARVIVIADDYGYPYKKDVRLAEKHLASMGPSSEDGLNDVMMDRLVEASDDAEAWLNENVCADGYCWLWCDGEFYYEADRVGDEYDA